VLEIHDSRLVNHLSAERYWEARAARREEETGPDTTVGEQPAARRPAPPAPGSATTRGAPTAASATRSRDAAEQARRRRARQRALEADILRTEKQLGEIDARLADPHTYDDRTAAAALAGERQRAETRLEELYDTWDEIAE